MFVVRGAGRTSYAVTSLNVPSIPKQKDINNGVRRIPTSLASWIMKPPIEVPPPLTNSLFDAVGASSRPGFSSGKFRKRSSATTARGALAIMLAAAVKS